MLPIWGPGCPQLPGVSLGKGLDPGGGRGPRRCCSQGVISPALPGTASALWALYWLPLPQWEKSVDEG